MPELYDRVFAVNPPIIDGLLYSGVYLFVGAPKVGKSFLMAQLAYHVSTSTPMWNFEVKPATVLYLALEDDYARLQSRFYRMFGTDSTDNLHFSTVANSVSGGLENQLRGFIEAHKERNSSSSTRSRKSARRARKRIAMPMITKLLQGSRRLQAHTESA